MKYYDIITTYVFEGVASTYEQSLDIEDDVQKLWIEACEEADALRADYDSIKVDLVSYEVAYELVSTDPELSKYRTFNEEVVLTK